MSWFDQLSIWDKAPKGQEAWRARARDRSEKFAIAVLQEYNYEKLKPRYGCVNSEICANDLAMQINARCGFTGMFRVECGGDSLDNPCISIVWTNSKAVADAVIEMCGKENTELVEL